MHPLVGILPEDCFRNLSALQMFELYMCFDLNESPQAFQ